MLIFDQSGKVIEDTSPGLQPIGFAGGLYDSDTGFLHFGARDYDPSTGRFLQRDPIGFAGGNTNLYGYVLQDPVNAADPNGTGPVASAACLAAASGVYLTATGSLNSTHEQQISAINQQIAALQAGQNSSGGQNCPSLSSVQTNSQIQALQSEENQLNQQYSSAFRQDTARYLAAAAVCRLLTAAPGL